MKGIEFAALLRLLALFTRGWMGIKSRSEVRRVGPPVGAVIFWCQVPSTATDDKLP